MMTVPYVDLPLQVRSIKPELMAAIERVLEHGQYVLGPEVQQFERQFADYCGTKFAVGVGNGTDALLLALRAIGVGPGDEFITAPNSFVASAAAGALLGAKPVFVDVLEADMNMNPALLERAINSHTKAIIPVHLAGQPADMDPILEVAHARSIPVIEDAAQAVGSRYGNRRAGSMGLVGCFSLHPLKNLHAFGDAGIISTNDEGVYEWLLKARNHGLRSRDQSDFWSVNSRLDTLHAATLTVQLEHLDGWTRERRTLAQEYCSGLRQVVGVPDEMAGRFHTYQTFMIRAERRARLIEHLNARGIQATVHYPLPIHMIDAAKSLGYAPDDFPVARSLSDRIVSLPLFPGMTAQQQAHVVDGVRSFYGS